MAPTSSSVELMEIPHPRVPTAICGHDTETLQAEEELASDMIRVLSPQSDPSSGEDTSVKAWLAVLGAFFYLFPTYGNLNCLGYLF